MKIEKLRYKTIGKRARVTSDIIWEDCGRPAQEIYFEVEEQFADDISCNPHAFLIGCALPAMHFGEKRIFINGEICPELRDGLMTAMSLLRHWYYDTDQEPVQIEAKTRSDLPTPRTPKRSGFFFSGGIDSFATLIANRLGFPLKHPWSIRDGLLVYGLEIEEPEAFDYVLHSLSEVAQEFDITLVPVYTNLFQSFRSEDAANDWRFWNEKYESAVFSAIAHSFSKRLNVVSIASSLDIPHLRPLGSHPLLDPNYSSVDLRIRHDGLALSKLEKTKLVAGHDAALRHLRVCNHYKRYEPGRLNCGNCRKCVQTMLTLLALGVLDQTHAFPRNDISEELLLAKGSPKTPYQAFSYQQLIPNLTEKGRHDLVRAIKHIVARYYDCLPGLKAKIGRFDRKYFKGNLTKLKNSIAA